MYAVKMFKPIVSRCANNMKNRTYHSGQGPGKSSEEKLMASLMATGVTLWSLDFLADLNKKYGTNQQNKDSEPRPK